ncbi:MAG: TatD family hydrolase [Rikenellaceae bacterium]
MEYPFVNIHTHFEEREALTTSSIGIHPWDAEDADLSSDDAAIANEARQSAELDVMTTQCVGEIGLDFSTAVDRTAQKRLFIAQLKLAKKHRKVVIIHCVRAFEAVMEILATFPLRGVVFHGFIGSVQQMNQAVERGYYLSFGERTFASPKTQKALREAPIEQIFFETDTSDTSIEEIYQRATKLRIEDEATLRCELYNNYKRLFDTDK